MISWCENCDSTLGDDDLSDKCIVCGRMICETCWIAESCDDLYCEPCHYDKFTSEDQKRDDAKANQADQDRDNL